MAADPSAVAAIDYMPYLLVLCLLMLSPAAAGRTPTGATGSAASANADVQGATMPEETGTGSRGDALLEALAAGRLGPTALRLEAAGADFVARYEPAGGHGKPRAALLVVADTTRTITASPVIEALLHELPPNAHATLALQDTATGLRAGTDPADNADAGVEADAEVDTDVTADPAPASAQDDADVTRLHARIAAGLAHLRSDEVTAVALFAMGESAAAATAFAQRSGDIAAVFTTGAWQGDLPAGDIPLHEILFTADATGAAYARAREKHARRLGRRYLRVELAGRGADDSAAAVARRLRGWLRAVDDAG